MIAPRKKNQLVFNSTTHSAFSTGTTNLKNVSESPKPELDKDSIALSNASLLERVRLFISSQKFLYDS